MVNSFVIRDAIESDFQQILDIYAPYINDSAVSFELEVPRIEEFSNRILKLQESLPWIVACEGETVIGYAYANNHRSRLAYQWSKELSVYVHPEARGKKIATQLYDELIQRLKAIPVNTVLAGITMSQKESIAFHEKYGFQLVGVYNAIGYKFGKWHDVGWWELKIGNDFNPSP